MLISWFIPMALAADCDPSKLRSDLDEATPIAVPRAYLALAECDATAARAAAEPALARMLAGRDGNDAVLAALDVGADAVVATWMGNLQSGERTTTIDFLGKQCGEHPAVASFFATSLEREGTDFWEQRWYRGLSDCRTDGVRATLDAALVDPFIQERANRGLYFGILEVYARNLKADALPTLTEALDANAGDQDASLVVRAFADAANVGQLGGMDAADTKAAIAALVELAPKLNANVIDTVRDTLVALGAVRESGQMVRYRWPDRFADAYTYQAAVHELASCKNGKQQAKLHHGHLIESGERFPDTVAAGLEAQLIEAWGLDLASKCKGEGELFVEMTREPMSDDAQADEWLDAQREAFQGRVEGFSKVEEIAQDPTSI
jgi:hypothetical protein